MNPIRNSAKALIIRDDAVLCIRKEDSDGIYHILPGGGQERGESLIDALRRECREEMGVEIEVGGLRFVRDYIGRNHEYADVDLHTHEVELMFVCSLAADAQPSNGDIPDDGQIGVVWVPRGELVGARLYPIALARVLATEHWEDASVYLGDVY